MEAKEHPGLFFIGEVVDVSGHLGGFNFQWAWSSGYVAGLNCPGGAAILEHLRQTKSEAPQIDSSSTPYTLVIYLLLLHNANHKIYASLPGVACAHQRNFVPL